MDAKKAYLTGYIEPRDASELEGALLVEAQVVAIDDGPYSPLVERTPSISDSDRTALDRATEKGRRDGEREKNMIAFENRKVKPLNAQVSRQVDVATQRGQYKNVVDQFEPASGSVLPDAVPIVTRPEPVEAVGTYGKDYEVAEYEVSQYDTNDYNIAEYKSVYEK